MIEALGKNVRAVRSILEQRAVAARAKDFLGQRIYFEGFGELTAAGSDGQATASFKPRESRLVGNLTVPAHAILILVDANVASSSPDEETVSKTPRKRVFGMF
jgi:hypothetical protein